MKQKFVMAIIAAVITGVIVVVVMIPFFMAINKTGQSMEAIVSASKEIGALSAFFAFLLKLQSPTREEKMQKKDDKKRGVVRFKGIRHVTGLEAPGNCKASVGLAPAALEVTCGGREYVLPIEKIRSVDFQKDIDEAKYMQSHINTPPTTRTKRDIRGYAIISYERAKGESFKTVVLKDEAANTRTCAKLIDALRPRINRLVDRVQL